MNMKKHTIIKLCFQLNLKKEQIYRIIRDIKKELRKINKEFSCFHVIYFNLYINEIIITGWKTMDKLVLPCNRKKKFCRKQQKL